MTPTRIAFAGAAFFAPFRGFRRSPVDFPAMVSSFLKRMPRLSAHAGAPASGVCVSERGVVAVGAGGSPRVAGGTGGTGGGRSSRTGGRPRLVGRDLATGLTAAACRARHLGGGVAERGADLVDLELDRGALLAFARLVGALLEATG